MHDPKSNSQKPKKLPARLLVACDESETWQIRLLLDTTECRRLLDQAEKEGHVAISWNPGQCPINVIMEVVDTSKKMLSETNYFSAANDPKLIMGYVSLL